jgi:hypothetical protein
MPDINIGQQGKLKSLQKLTKINGDDEKALIYRNMGNNHASPFIWGETLTFSGAGTKTLVSGVKFHGMNMADYCKVAVSGPSGSNPYVTKTSLTNVITVTSSAAGAVDVIVMVGVSPDIAKLKDRGNTGASQMLP